MKLTAATAAALLAVLLTWPLARDLGSAGRIDSGDGRYSIWNVAWVARALTSDASLYDANIFHPHPWALVFSESNLVAGVLAVPAWLVTGNGLAAANFAILVSFALSAFTAFLLVHHLTRHAVASALAAVMFAFSPYAFARLPHMQLLMTFGLPLSMLALHGLVARPAVGSALRLGAALWVTALACGYYGIFAGLAVAWGMVWFATAHGLWRARHYWLMSGIALLTAGLLTAPFLAPYEIIREGGFARSLDDARMFRAGWRAYLASPVLVHQWMLPVLGTWREVLFPGFLPPAFALVALVALRRVERSETTGVVGFYVSIGVLAFWASLGPDAGLYTALFHGLPFFDLIRAPARFGVLVTLAVTTLAGMGMAAMLTRLGGRRYAAAAGLLAAATLAESYIGPLPLVRRSQPHAVYQRLARMSTGAVAEFPYFVSVVDRHRHTEYMLASLDHWQPLINGYSDFEPDAAVTDGRVLAGFPDEESWQVLERRGARYIVMHWRQYPDYPDIRRRVFAEVGVRLRTVLDTEDVSLFELLRPGQR